MSSPRSSLPQLDRRAMEILCEELGVPFEEDVDVLQSKLAFAFGLAARDGNLDRLEKRLIHASILSASISDEVTTASETAAESAVDDGTISRATPIHRSPR